MQKRIVLVLGISSISGAIKAQEAPTEAAVPVAVEQAQAAPVAADTITPEPPSDHTPQPTAPHSDSAAPVQAEHAVTSATQEVPAAAPAEVSPEPVTPTPVAQETKPVESEKQPEPAPAPQAPVQNAQPEVSEEHAEDLEIKGIDTVDVAEPKGNWLYKRIWWEKAERTYEKIKQLAEKIQEARIIFFARRTDLDRNTLDPFYLGQGFSQGELTEIINFLTAQLEQDRKEGALDEKEQALLNALSEEKKTLESLQKGVKAVTGIDHALDDSLLKLNEQLQQARSYEQQAWENFKAINRELSDKRARELYYAMDTYWRNLNNINTYISDSFSTYFDQLTDRVKQEIDKIKTTMDALKEKGIDIQVQAQKLKAGKPAETEEEETPTVSEPAGIGGTIWHWITAPFAAIAHFFGNAMSWITGSGATEELSLARPERSATE